MTTTIAARRRRFTSRAQLLRDVTELGKYQSCHREPHCILSAREHEDRLSSNRACGRATHHRGRADLLEAEHPEQLAQSTETFFEHAVESLECIVARCDSRA